MTGFGVAQVSLAGWQLSVECRSVNHRGLDVRVHLPRDWAWLEPRALELVRAAVQRGRVDVRINVERNTDSDHAALIDSGRFSAVVRELRQLSETHALDNGVTLSDVLSFRQVFAGDEPPDDVQDRPELDDVLAQAVRELIATRDAEGARLFETLNTLITGIDEDVTLIRQRALKVADDYRSRLEERVRDALEKFGVGEIEEHRLLQEVAYYAERSDIAEEVQRASSHIIKLREIVDAELDEPVGKTLDFYLQEMMREANTMASKTSSTDITDAVIRIKSSVEKMREQAANIE